MSQHNESRAPGDKFLTKPIAIIFTTVFIDLVDFAERRVVWQGVAVADVNDKVAQRLRDAIFTSVNKIMAEYPHTAGK